MVEAEDGSVERAAASAVVASPCPSCGAPQRRRAGFGRLVCERCGWCREADETEVDSLSCPGCDQRTVCESRPTSLVEERSSQHVLPDGGRVLVRPLLYSDRDELSRGFDRLSPESKRLRFFNAPERLTGGLLEYLTNLDYHDRFAVAAFALDEVGQPGVGVARWIRDRDDPTTAEAAITVLDDHQGRGIGTLLMVVLAEQALQEGIRRFTASARWENKAIIEPLLDFGATIEADEPGIARLVVELPGADEPVPDSLPVRLLKAFGRWLGRLRDEAAS